VTMEEGEDNFWLYLPSNHSLSYYPANTTQDYLVELDEYETLRGQWVMGAHELFIPSPDMAKYSSALQQERQQQLRSHNRRSVTEAAVMLSDESVDPKLHVMEQFQKLLEGEIEFFPPLLTLDESLDYQYTHNMAFYFKAYRKYLVSILPKLPKFDFLYIDRLFSETQTDEFSDMVNRLNERDVTSDKLAIQLWFMTISSGENLKHSLSKEFLKTKIPEDLFELTERVVPMIWRSFYTGAIFAPPEHFPYFLVNPSQHTYTDSQLVHVYKKFQERYIPKLPLYFPLEPMGDDIPELPSPPPPPPPSSRVTGGDWNNPLFNEREKNAVIQLEFDNFINGGPALPPSFPFDKVEERSYTRDQQYIVLQKFANGQLTEMPKGFPEQDVPTGYFRHNQLIRLFRDEPDPRDSMTDINNLKTIDSLYLAKWRGLIRTFPPDFDVTKVSRHLIYLTTTVDRVWNEFISDARENLPELFPLDLVPQNKKYTEAQVNKILSTTTLAGRALYTPSYVLSREWLTDLRGDIEKEYERVNREVDRLKSVNEILQTNLNDCQGEIKLVEEESTPIEEHRRIVNQLRRSKEVLETRLEQVTAERDERVADYNASRALLTQSYQTKRTSIENLQAQHAAELEAKQSRLDELKSLYETQKTRNEEQLLLLERHKATISRQNSNIASLRAEKHNLIEAATQLQAQLSENERQIAAKSLEISELNAQKSARGEEIDKCRTDLAALTERNKVLSTRVRLSNNKQKQLRDKTKVKEALLNDAIREKNRVTEFLEHSTTAMRDYLNRIEKLEFEIEGFATRKRNEIQAKFAELDSFIAAREEELRNGLREADERLSNIATQLAEITGHYNSALDAAEKKLNTICEQKVTNTVSHVKESVINDVQNIGEVIGRIKKTIQKQKRRMHNYKTKLLSNSACFTVKSADKEWEVGRDCLADFKAVENLLINLIADLKSESPGEAPPTPPLSGDEENWLEPCPSPPATPPPAPTESCATSSTTAGIAGGVLGGAAGSAATGILSVGGGVGGAVSGAGTISGATSGGPSGGDVGEGGIDNPSFEIDPTDPGTKPSQPSHVQLPPKGPKKVGEVIPARTKFRKAVRDCFSDLPELFDEIIDAFADQIEEALKEKKEEEEEGIEVLEVVEEEEEEPVEKKKKTDDDDELMQSDATTATTATTTTTTTTTASGDARKGVTAGAVAKSGSSFSPVIYMCSNIVQEQVVGDTKLPVLRAFMVSDDDIKSEGLHYIPFPIVQWKPIRINNFKNIRIWFLDHKLEKLKLTAGHTMVVAQFKLVG
jgi:hypothetical protein